MALIITWLDLLPADRTDQKLIRQKNKNNEKTTRSNQRKGNEGEQHL